MNLSKTKYYFSNSILILSLALVSSCSKKGSAGRMVRSSSSAGSSGSAIAIQVPSNNGYINSANNSATFAVSGTCTPLDNNSSKVTIQIDGNDAAIVNCSSGAFNATIDTTSVVDGATQISALIPGSLGVSVTSEVNLTKDTVAPVIASVVLSGQASVNSSTSTTYDVTFSDANLGTITPASVASAVTFSGSNVTDCSKTVTAVSPAVARITISGCSDSSGSSGILLGTSAFNDAAGNPLASSVGSVASFTINNASVAIAIHSPADNAWINQTSDSSSYAVTGDCTETDQTQLDGQTVTIKNGSSTLGSGACTSGTFNISVDTTALSESAHAFTAEVTDKSGNAATSSTVNIKRDVTKPTLTTVSSPSIGIVNASTSTSYTLTFSDANLGSLSNSSIDSAISVTGASSGCLVVTSGTDPNSRTVSITGCNGNGSAGISIVGTNLFDLAGNSMNVVAGPYTSFTVANAGPSIGITTPSSNGWINIATNSANYSVQGTCSAAGENVNISIDSGAVTGVATCNGSLFSGSVDTTSLSEGSHTVVASITSSGLTSSSTNNFKVDVTNPTVTISSPNASIVTSSGTNSFTLTFSDANPSTLVSATLDSAVTVSGNGATCSKSTNVTSSTTAVVTLSNCTGNGSPTISVASSAWSDLASNPLTGATSSSFTVDNSVPTITITSPTDGTYVNSANTSATYVVTGTCSESGRAVSLSVNGASVSMGNCSGSNDFSGTINTNALPSGSNSLVASVTDAAGNTGTSTTVNITKDVSVPTVVISSTNTRSPTTQAVIPMTVTFSKSVTGFGVGNITVTGGTVSSFVATSGTVYTFNFTPTTADNGTLTINIASGVATDSAGNNNTAATQYSKIYYTKVPTITGTSPTNSTTPSLTVDNIITSLNANIYSDSSCSTSKGTAASAGTSQAVTSSTIYASTTFYADVTDADGNKSACSVSGFSITLDTTAPLAATSPTWTGGSTSTSVSLGMSWTKSSSSDLGNQKIQFYSSSACGTASSLIDLSSSTATTYTYSAPSSGTYSFKVVSFDTAGNSTESACSGNMVVTLPSLTLTPSSFTFPVGQSLTVNFSASGGASSGYVYSIVSGQGTINGSTGVYTGGSRTPGTTTVIQVSDGTNTVSTTITHSGTSVNGTVYAAASDGTNMYVGGSFTMANPITTKGFFPATTANGLVLDYGIASGFNIGATINAVVVSGGFAYVGGTFTSYKGTTIQNLAKINLTTGALDTTFTQSTGPNSAVYALAINGTSLYVGGSLTGYRATTSGMNYLVKVDTTSGARDTAFSSPINYAGAVYALLVANSGLYVGGSFSGSSGGTAGNTLIQINLSTGAGIKSLNGTTSPAGTCYTLATDGSAFLYVGGSISSWRNNSGNVDGTYQNLLKINWNTGALDTTFNLANGFPNGAVKSVALSSSGTSLYVGGAFTTYRGSANGAYLAKVSATNGIMDATFNSSTSAPNNSVNAVALSSDGTSLYVGGAFTSYRGDSKGVYLAKVGATNGALDTSNFNTTTVQTDNIVNALLVSGSNLYVGGTFSNYRGTPVQNIAKFSLSNWIVDTTFSQTTGANAAVRAMVISGASIYIGGDFTSYRGDTKGLRLAKLDTTSGNMDTTTFNTTAASGPDNSVYAMLVNSNDLYIGGAFVSYRGSTAGYRMAKLNASTGVMNTTFNTTNSSGPDATIYALAFSSDKSKIYMGGSYTSYRSSTYCVRLCVINTTDGSYNSIFQASGSPNDGTVYALALSGSNLFVGGSFTQYNYSTKGAYLAKISTASGALDTATFNTTANNGPTNAVNALALSPSGTSLYVGGNFVSYRGSTNGYRLVKANESTGAMDATFNSTMLTGPDAAVNTLLPSTDGTKIYIGGAFTSYRGDSTTGYATSVSTTNGAASW